MRSVFIVALTTSLLGGCMSSAPMLDEATRNAVTAEVQALTDSVFAAASTLQIDPTIASFAPDQLHADQGALRTVEDIRTTYRDLYATLTALAFNRERTVVHVLAPDAAVVVSEGTYATTPKQGAAGSGHAAWTYVWRRQNGTWRMVHTHQSLVQPVTTP